MTRKGIWIANDAKGREGRETKPRKREREDAKRGRYGLT
jgi:hypothetical protein